MPKTTKSETTSSKTTKQTPAVEPVVVPTVAPVVEPVAAKSTKKSSSKKAAAPEVVPEPVVVAPEPVAAAEPVVVKAAKKSSKATKAAKAEPPAAVAEVPAPADEAEEPVEQEAGKRRVRYFRCVYTLEGADAAEDKDVFGRYSGYKPKQAAGKALTSILRHREKHGLALHDEIPYSMVECTRGGSHKVSQYIGRRIKLDTPVIVSIKTSDGSKKEIEYNFTNKVTKVKSEKRASPKKAAKVPVKKAAKKVVKKTTEKAKKTVVKKVAEKAKKAVKKTASA